jgi:hypothetical protein
MGRLAAAAVIAAVALAAVPAPAQAGGVDLFGGYAYARGGDQSFHGADVSATWRLTDRLGIELDVANQFGPDQLSRLSYAAGPSYMLIKGGDTQVFVHAMAGRLRSRASISIYSVTISQSDTSTAVLVGGGIVRRLGERWSLRLSGEYVGLDASPEWQSQPRAALGVSYRIGATSGAPR